MTEAKNEMNLDACNGYYSLIQYSPDGRRIPSANIGVVLLYPGCQHKPLWVRIDIDLSQVQRLFEDSDLNHILQRALTLKAALERSVNTLSDLEYWHDVSYSPILISRPHGMRVVDPDSDVRVLFEDLVLGTGEEWIRNEPASACAVDPDPVSAPAHYYVTVSGTPHEDGTVTVECKDLMYALGLGHDFYLGAAFKYLFRCFHKGRLTQDIAKAKQNLEYYLEHRCAPED